MKRKLLPLAAWSLTALMSAAIAVNALFGQPDNGRSVQAALESGTDAADMKVDSPDAGARTIQLRHDPVVEAVQRELAAAGYYKGVVDGVIGRKTRQAISAYQQAVGLAPDGLVQRGRIKPRVSFRIPFRVAPLPAGPSEW